MRSPFVARALGVSALLLLSSTPALASDTSRAKAAIAEARGKIDAAHQAGVGGEVPRLQAQAEAYLREAEDDLARSHEKLAIAAAQHASEVADSAIAEARRSKAAADDADRASAAAANAAANDAADAANARAASAEQAAAAASADAAAARAAPPVVVMQPPSTTTTVVKTETVKPAPAAAKPRVAAKPRAKPRRVVRRTVHRAAAHPATVEKTTTTVTTTHN
jgi:hypothetical protein